MLAVEGKQMKEMAQQLHLAIDTIREYLSSAYRKVGVDGRGPLVAQALAQASAHPFSKGISATPSADIFFSSSHSPA